MRGASAGGPKARGKALARSLTRSRQEAQGAKKRGRALVGGPEAAPVAEVAAVRIEAATIRMASRYRATPQCQELPIMVSLVRRSAPATAVYPVGKWCSTSRTAGGGTAQASELSPMSGEYMTIALSA